MWKVFWPKSADHMPRTLTMQNISDIFLELLDHRVCIFQYQSSFFTLPLIFLDTWYGYSFNYQACILLYFLWFLDFFLILFKGNFVQIIKYFLRSVLHWRFSRNSVRYSCNNITTTLIQTSRLFYFGFFSKTNHQMII